MDREDRRLRVGVITTTHGVHGEVRVFPTTDDPRRFDLLSEVTVRGTKGEELFHIESVRYFKNMVLLKFREINDPETAALYRRADLLIDESEALPLSEDEYFIRDLIGLRVYTEEGRFLGILKDVYTTAANDVYLVSPETDSGEGSPEVQNAEKGDASLQENTDAEKKRTGKKKRSRNKKKELLIPATAECVQSICILEGKMIVRLLPGLEEL